MDREQVDLIMLLRNHQRFTARFFQRLPDGNSIGRCRSSIWMTERLEDASSSVPKQCSLCSAIWTRCNADCAEPPDSEPMLIGGLALALQFSLNLPASQHWVTDADES